MWRITIRLLSDTHSVAPNSRSRGLKRRPLTSQKELHCSSCAPQGFSSDLDISRQHYLFLAPLYSQHYLRPCAAERKLNSARQIHALASEIRVQIKSPLLLTGTSRVYKQLPLTVPRRVFTEHIHSLVQDFGCSASPSSPICGNYIKLSSGSIQHSRSPVLSARLHSAALAFCFEESPSQETALLHMRLGECSPSPPRIKDVHGTLNTVLWGIPMIANQISCKSLEGQTSTVDDTIHIPQLTEFVKTNLVTSASSSFPSVLEDEAVSAYYPPQSEAQALQPCIEELNTCPSPREETKPTEQRIEEALKGKQNKLRRRQMQIESQAWQRATEEYKNQLKEMCKNQLAPNLPFMKTLFLSWFEPLTNAIAAEQEIHRSGGARRKLYGPYLDLLPADKLAVITMHKTVAKLVTEEAHGGLKSVIPIMGIGEAVEEEVTLQQILKRRSRKKKNGEAEAAEAEVANEEQLQRYKVLQKQVEKFIKQGKRRALKKKVKEIDSSEPWSSVVHAQVGSRLLELLIQTAYIQDPDEHTVDGSAEIRPAFRHLIKTIGAQKSGHSKSVGVIECDPYISKGLMKMAQAVVTPYMPMLVKPVPWQGYRKGGHLVLPTCIMRTHGAKDLRETLKKTPRRQLKNVFEALNTLGETKWRINKGVLEIAEKIWAEGGRIADLVDRDNVPEPQKPETDDADILKKWRWEVLRVRRTNRELHAQRCDIELKLSVAREMKNEECFYYPHNIDFRGRAYPLHPHLNHLGSDMCRGLLEFAEGRPLKSTGLRWLKIQLANLYGNGVDKLSFDDRVAFTDENLENIRNSAKQPLEGSRWWLKAEDPFQCLATCMEISDALSLPDAETFISHLPVHQDGSCNGLQHYAALGRDILGAESVNLTAQPKPADVYTGIAVRVKGLLEKDFEVESLSESARMLHSQVDRKLVKQTVMTSVYGVTYIGARDQILNRLQERPSFNDDKLAFNLSCYAAKTTLEALGEMFTAARIIMGWLGDCAKIIAAENHTVRWKTPLGLPVVQPYRRPQRAVVKTSLQSLAIMSMDSAKVMVRRQKTAFPPNFVHSLDSTHMMMTASACSMAGLTFAGVHDSYWTHAGDVDKMNTILRKKFVELYSQPILENLLKDFKESFPDLTFPPIPARGNFELAEVLQSPYFFN